MRELIRALACLGLALLAHGAGALEPDKFAVERRSVTVEGRTLNYRSTAGALAVTEGTPARIFFVAYELEGADPAQRPLAFAFNGGPGAASAYLHLGALGPRRLALNDDGTVPPPPARLVDNDTSWLAFADLVFIDPVGTGYSRAAGKDDKDGDGNFWGVREDVETLARFIRLYLTRNARWLSPKYLVGESYGGFRVALLADLLPAAHGIALNGAVLISPALQFAITRPDGYDVLPMALKLPTLTAVAMHHGKSTLARPPGGVDRGALAPVETWAVETLLPGLARGGALTPPAQAVLADQVAGFTGLPVELVRRNHAVVGGSDLAKHLLRGSGRVLDIYDGAVTGVDAEPESGSLERPDQGLRALNAALLPAFSAYARDELKLQTDLPYLLLNHEASGQWRWRGGRGQGYAGAADRLKAGMALNPQLRVLVAHGLYDLVTPYFASAYVIDQMHLPEALRANLAFRTYAAGHMIYTHKLARDALYRDAKALFQPGQ